MQAVLETVTKRRLTAVVWRLARQSGLLVAYIRQLVRTYGIVQVRVFCQGLRAGDDHAGS